MLSWLTENGVSLAILVTLLGYIVKSAHTSGEHKAGLERNYQIGISAHKRIDAILMWLTTQGGKDGAVAGQRDAGD